MGNIFTYHHIDQHTYYENEIDNLNDKIELQNRIITTQQYIIDILKTNNSNSNNQEGGSTNIELTKKNKDYEYLVFSGGGIKGVSYCGALDVLASNGVLYDANNKMKIKGFAGTSAGAITAALLAIGMSLSDLRELITTLDFSKLLDDKTGYIRDAINFIGDYGVCQGLYLEQLIGDQVEKLCGNREYTIQQLYDEKGTTLVIVTTDMNNEKSIYLYPNCPDTRYSNIPIYKAVRMSMSIPFLYEPVLFNGNYCVDGGVLDNYAIHVFDGDYPGDPNARLNLCEPNPKTLGLRIITTNNVIGYTDVPRQNISNVVNYGLSFIDTFMTENDRRIMTNFNFLRTINIVTNDYPLRQFNLTEKQKAGLIQAGSEYTTAFFADI